MRLCKFASTRAIVAARLARRDESRDEPGAWLGAGPDRTGPDHAVARNRVDDTRNSLARELNRAADGYSMSALAIAILLLIH